MLLPADNAKETDLILGGEQYEEKEVMDCAPRSFCSACGVRCLFEPGCNFGPVKIYAQNCLQAPAE